MSSVLKSCLLCNSFVLLLSLVFNCECFSQGELKGVVKDNSNGDVVPFVNVLLDGTQTGTTTDFDGVFSLSNLSFPVTIEYSFVGYETLLKTYAKEQKKIVVRLVPSSVNIDQADVIGDRISEKQKQRPLTIETMDALAIKETPAANFYDGLGNLKGVDLTAASLGFKVINTRGFNSTSPVRSLQLIDGVDNQAPGLNFSLGNFLGSPELDVQKVDIVSGASSAFYGPNAFNGVINIENKNPFYTEGLSANFKVGERALTEIAVRWADVLANKDEKPWMAYKFNVFFLTADDWEAENYDPVYESGTAANNPGKFNAVNVYGDEPSSDFSGAPGFSSPGLNTFYRTGYEEKDLVDYTTENIKGNVAFHFRTKPDKDFESPEIILAANAGTGTTVYQGDNRFRLEDIFFYQTKVEYRKKDKFFVRAYMTAENAGNSYDPYATAIKLRDEGRSNNSWFGAYSDYWNNVVVDQMIASGYTDPSNDFTIDPITFMITYDQDSVNAASSWLLNNNQILTDLHTQTEEAVNTGYGVNPGQLLVPGSEEFDEAFKRLTTSKNNPEEEGTLFFDESKLFHIQGEYKFQPDWTDGIILGGNGRVYKPFSDGTIFSDTSGVSITNSEFGFYTGIEKKLKEKNLILNGTLRMDKNQNFSTIFTPALSAVWQLKPKSFLRFSFSSALRNPTLSDQYLFLDVGPAILSGNLNGVKDLITVDSYNDFRNAAFPNPDDLEYFDIDPVRPERVKTFETGYRTTIGERLYVDAGYYYSIYDDFLGFNIGLVLENTVGGISENIEVYRYSANSKNQVTTQGASIGANYYLNKTFGLNGNYSWNKLNVELEDDPIIPAFNTPEHKFNLGFSGRDISFKAGEKDVKTFGFNINYKWIEGFLFEGSPQFTGQVPRYDLLDVQINFASEKLNTVYKLGATNILNNKQFQTYGGPRIGRLAYFSITYELNKK